MSTLRSERMTLRTEDDDDDPALDFFGGGVEEEAPSPTRLLVRTMEIANETYNNINSQT